MTGAERTCAFGWVDEPMRLEEECAQLRAILLGVLLTAARSGYWQQVTRQEHERRAA